MEEFTRTYSVIHLDSIYKNIEQVRKRVGNETRIMAIVKANAYGHGAIRVTNEIKDKVDSFAVATVKEALVLRNNGINNPILILGYVCKEEYETVIRNNITFALLTEEMAIEISKTAKKMGITANCHVKINTGMNRIGFPVNAWAVDAVQRIAGMEGIYCEGIFTHFATADSADKSYTIEQFNRFMDFINELEKRGVTFKIRHCSNSAAIIDMPEYKLDMVREGIILYGLKPSDEVSPDYVTYPAMELKSHIIFIKELPAGESISYGRTYVTDKPTKVATVAIGYADGYPRSLSSKGYVLVHGQKAPVIGRVCMDQMMIDVTDIEDVKVEDVATIIGKDGNEEITCEELGESSGRFNYELVCDIAERVERKYVK